MRPNDPRGKGNLSNKRRGQGATGERRRKLVREMVVGAILPGLLARKDSGVFDRGPNVLRLQERTASD